MLSFPGSLKVFVALESCDMRKGFNGLAAMVSERLGEELKSGALFVFSNRRHTRLKMIYRDGSGIWLLTKRIRPEKHLFGTKIGKGVSVRGNMLRRLFNT